MPFSGNIAMRRILEVTLAAAVLAAPLPAQRKMPYWASISVGETAMRTGPGREFPASWIYKRADLPVRIVKSYKSGWRVKGWIIARHLSENRTGLVRGEIRPLRQSPNASAAIIWRAEPGVVGRISECGNGWCKFDVKGRMGYIESSQIWGTEDAVTPTPAHKP
jgi:SH3-like domain-containing protein